MFTDDERKQISEWYGQKADTILRATGGWGIDMYSFPWLENIDPIQRLLLDECKTEGLVMHPEFPVGPFWVALGNPRTKVAIDFSRNLTRDKQDVRESVLRDEQGWTIYRLDASHIPVDHSKSELMELLETIGGFDLISRVRAAHGNQTRS